MSYLECPLRPGPFPSLNPFFTVCTQFYEYSAARIRATLLCFYMTTGTALSVAAIIQPDATHHLASDPRQSTTHFLIANPRLEFRVTSIRITELPISNRERIAIFQREFPGLSILELQASSLQKLIVTPGLENAATSVHSTTSANPNRYKTRLLRSPWRTQASRSLPLAQVHPRNTQVTRHSIKSGV